MFKYLGLQIGLSVCACVALHGAMLRESLDGLRENHFGFVVVDVGITEEDLSIFSAIDIEREWFFHQFGELEKIQERISEYLSKVGSNDHELTLQAAARLTQIVHQVLNASVKDSAWVHLRSSVPTDKYDLPRWHMDGYYYIPEGPDDLLFKFAATLIGPSTLFYLLPPELRSSIKMKVRDRNYMKEFCQIENIVSPRLGEGVVFVGGRGVGLAALHSEPPIHENRLFFSIVPCTENQLVELKARVLGVYPQDSTRSIVHSK